MDDPRSEGPWRWLAGVAVVLAAGCATGPSVDRGRLGDPAFSALRAPREAVATPSADLAQHRGSVAAPASSRAGGSAGKRALWSLPGDSIDAVLASPWIAADPLTRDWLQEAQKEAAKAQEKAQGGEAPAQGAPPQGGQAADPHAEADEAGRKLANPLSDIWAMFTEFDFTFNGGRAVQGGQNKFGFNMIFQPIMPIPLTEDWNMITRPILPIFFTTPVPEPGGGFDRQDVGLGDLALPLVPANKHGVELGDGQLMFGVGPTFLFPTATNNTYGTDTWEIGPAAVVVYKTDKITAGVFPQYWYSYADRSGDQPATSHGSFLYFFWYNLPQAWQVGTAPTITYNHKAPSDEAWNVPFGILVAKTVKIGDQIIKFQFGLEYSAISQDTFGKEVAFRFNVIPVIQSLVHEPLF